MKKVLFCVVLALTPSPGSAGFMIGPGNVPVTAGDGAFDIIAVDLTTPATLAPGTYTASRFDYQFTDFAGFQTKGTIAPVLLVGGGTTFTPVAVGATLTYAGPTAFVSTPFGGTASFTLTAPTTVYGGLYWEATYTGGPELRMPVGFTNFVGNAFVVYGGGFGEGADPPAVGTPIRGSAQGFFQRTYNFNIEVTAVPEPSSLLLALSGAGAVGWGWWRRRRTNSPANAM